MNLNEYKKWNFCHHSPSSRSKTCMHFVLLWKTKKDAVFRRMLGYKQHWTSLTLIVWTKTHWHFQNIQIWTIWWWVDNRIVIFGWMIQLNLMYQHYFHSTKAYYFYLKILNCINSLWKCMQQLRAQRTMNFVHRLHWCIWRRSVADCQSSSCHCLVCSTLFPSHCPWVQR